MDRQRLLIVADTHGTLDERVLAHAADCDAVVHAGDYGSDEVLQRLGAKGRTLHVVRGNNDPNGPGMPPLQLLLQLPGGSLAVEHGHHANPASVRHEVLRRHHPEARCIVYGHSHRTVLDTEAQGAVLNPGVAGVRRTFGGPACALLEATPGHWHLTLLRFGEKSSVLKPIREQRVAI